MNMPRGSGVTRLLLLGLAIGLVAGGVDAETLPRLRIKAPELRCPGIEGSFVALLRPGGEALLLSPRDFPGSRRDQTVDGGPTRVLVGEGSTWQLAAASVGGGSGRMWSAAYMTGDHRAAGCVAFDAARFSSEGDLVSYLRWLVNEVYLEIPEEHRPPAFRLGERRLALTIDQPGFKAMTVAGDEGATLAARVHGMDGVVLVRAYPLDDGATRFAVFTTSAERPFWSEAEQRSARFELVPAGDSFGLGDATARLRILGPSDAPSR